MNKSPFCTQRHAPRGAKTKIVYETIITTPPVASDILENTELVSDFKNRSVSRSAVDQYAGEMAAGKWLVESAAPIKLAWSKESGCYYVIDGQHRLLALIKAEVTIPLTYAFNVPHDAFRHTDNNLPRNLKSMLPICKGWAEGNSDVAPALRFLWRELNLGDAMTLPSDGKRASEGVILEEAIAAAPDMHAFYISQREMLLLLKRAKMGSISWWLYLFYRWARIDRELFDRVRGYIEETAAFRHASLLGKNPTRRQAYTPPQVSRPGVPRGLAAFGYALAEVIEMNDSTNLHNRERSVGVMKALSTAWNITREGKSPKTKREFVESMQKSKGRAGISR